MSQSLERAFWGESRKDEYCFAADYYLYVLLQLWAAQQQFGQNSTNSRSFWECFYAQSPNMNPYKSSAFLHRAMPGNNAWRFSLDQLLNNRQLTSLSVSMSESSTFATNTIDSPTPAFTITAVDWFERALSKLNLTPQSRQPQSTDEAA